MPDPGYVVLEGLIRAIRLAGRRYWQESGPLPAPGPFPWLRMLADAADDIRCEADALIAEFTPADTRALNALSVGVTGSWRLVPLVDRIGRYPYTDRLPATMTALAGVPRLRAADLAVLTAGSLIEPHYGNNWGVLRAHLTLVEPEGDGCCALRFPEQGLAIAWRAGEAFVFDDAFQHEAVNARQADRLVLLVELDRPLPRMLARVNALCQRWYRHHPVQRGVRDKVIARYVSAES